jgi:hypothetical protein
MALISCRECGKTVSPEAVACPHCGAPQQQLVPTAVACQSATHPAEGSHHLFGQGSSCDQHTGRHWGTTYALRNITSVKMAFSSAQVGGLILVLLFGAFISYT